MIPSIELKTSITFFFFFNSRFLRICHWTFMTNIPCKKNYNICNLRLSTKTCNENFLFVSIDFSPHNFHHHRVLGLSPCWGLPSRDGQWKKKNIITQHLPVSFDPQFVFHDILPRNSRKKGVGNTFGKEYTKKKSCI